MIHTPISEASGIDPTGQSTWPENFGPYESAFVFAKNHGDHTAFNEESSISRGLKEVLFFYPGSYRKTSESNLNFTPLVTIDEKSGVTRWDQLTMTPSQVMVRLDPRTGRRIREEDKRRFPNYRGRPGCLEPGATTVP